MEQNDFGFMITLMCLFTPFGAMALPIIQGSYNSGSQLAFILKLLVGSILLFWYFKSRMNKKRLKIVQSIRKILILILVLPLGFYFYVMIIHGENLSFSTLYLSLYLLVWAIYYIALTTLYKKGSYVEKRSRQNHELTDLFCD